MVIVDDVSDSYDYQESELLGKPFIIHHSSPTPAMPRLPSTTNLDPIDRISDDIPSRVLLLG